MEAIPLPSVGDRRRIISRHVVGYPVAAAILGLLVVVSESNPVRPDEPDTTAFARLGPIVVHGSEADHLSVGAGVFDFRRHSAAAAGTVEYRFGRKLFMIGPALGLMANADGGLFGYAGVYADLSHENFYITPQAGLGGYREGDGPDLGGAFQFRLSLDFAWRFANGHRLGIRAAHISNAYTHDINPGEEELLLMYSFPLGPYF